MRILFLSRWYPYPTDNGSKLRIYNLLRGLAQQSQITLLSFCDEPTADPDVPELRQICEDILIVPWKPFDPQSRQARLAFLSTTPRSYVDTFSPAMSELIERTLSTNGYDVVIASELEMAQYGRSLKKTPALLEDIEVEVLYGAIRPGHIASTAGPAWSHRQRSPIPVPKMSWPAPLSPPGPAPPPFLMSSP